MWQASDIGHTPTQLNSTQLTQAGNRVALPSCSLLSFFIGYVAHVTHEDAQGWGGVEHTHTHPSVATRLRRERDTHTRTWRASLHSHSSSSPLHVVKQKSSAVAKSNFGGGYDSQGQGIAQQPPRSPTLLQGECPSWTVVHCHILPTCGKARLP